jgi:tetratricopeptide (TPR) repeat protein
MKNSEKVIYYIWGTVITGFILSIWSTELWNYVRETHTIYLIPSTLVFFASISCIVLSKCKEDRLSQEFDILVKSNLLDKKHLNKINKEIRPYPKPYIPRDFIPYYEHHDQRPNTFYSEQDLVIKLTRGTNIILIGKPTEGKTRTLYEIIRRLTDFTIISFETNKLCSDEALNLLKGKKVLWLFDNMNRYDGSTKDFLTFLYKLTEITDTSVLAATCRDGPELSNYKSNTSTPLKDIYNKFKLKLVLKPANAKQMQQLKDTINETSKYKFPTLGSICMHEHFEEMQERFKALLHDQREIQAKVHDCFKAIQLLYAAHIWPITYQRINTILNNIYDRTIDRAQTCDYINILSENGFLVSSGYADQILPEDAYLTEEEAKFYYPPRSLEDDLQKLPSCLIKINDAAGLNTLALSYFEYYRKDFGYKTLELIINKFNDSNDPTLQAEVVTAIYNKGVMLWEKENSNYKAISCYDELIERFGNSRNAVLQERTAMAMYNKCVILGEQKSNDSAEIKCYDEIIERFGNSQLIILQQLVANSLYNAGVTLSEQEGNSNKAIDYYDKVIDRFRNNEDTTLQNWVGNSLYNKCVMIGSQKGKHNEAIACYNKVVECFGNRQELVANALYNKGTTLIDAGNDREAIKCFNKIVKRFGNSQEPALQERVAMALYNKGVALYQVDKKCEAIKCYDEIEKCFSTESQELDLQEPVAKALLSKGNILYKQEGSHNEAIICYNKVVKRYKFRKELALQEAVATAFLNKGDILWTQAGKYTEAINCYNELAERFENNLEPILQKLVANALHNKCAILGTQEGNASVAIKCIDNLIERIGMSQEPFLQKVANNALKLKNILEAKK